METSAHENVNVDSAFFTLAQMIDRTRGRSRILSYYEAAHARREQLDMATETYLRLIRAHVTDYGVLCEKGRIDVHIFMRRCFHHRNI